MERFCEQCGRELEEGEICSCAVMEEVSEEETEIEITSEAAEEPAELAEESEPAEEVQTVEEIPEPEELKEPEILEENEIPEFFRTDSQDIPPTPDVGQTSTSQASAAKEAEWINETRDTVKNGTKNVLGAVLPTLKAPVTMIKSIAEGKNSSLGFSFIITKLLTFIVIFTIILIKLQIGKSGIPYLKTIGLVILLTLGADLLETLLMRTVTCITGGKTSQRQMMAVVGVRALYDAVIIILAGVIYFISAGFALLAYGIISSLALYIQYSGYQALVKMDEDMKPYTFFAVKACITILMFGVMVIWGKGLYSIFFI